MTPCRLTQPVLFEPVHRTANENLPKRWPPAVLFQQQPSVLS